MKKKQKLGFLCGALVVVSLAAFGVSRHQETKEKIKSGAETILTIPTDSVTALSWKNDTSALSFHKAEDGSWSWDDDAAFPVDEEKIKTLLSPFESCESAFTIEEAKDTSQYGLDKPSCTINLTADGKDYAISLGSFSSMDSKRYASIGDDKVYLLENDLSNLYAKEISTMIKKDSIPAFNQISELKFKGSSSYSISKNDDENLSWCKTDQYYTDGKALDTGLVNGYVNSIKALNLSEYKSYNATAEELKDCGLDTPVLSVEISYEDEKDGKAEKGTFTLALGVNKKELEQAVKNGSYSADGRLVKASDSENDKTEDSKTSEVPAFFCRINDSKIIYKLQADSYNKLISAAYNDLRHKQVFTADFDTVTSVDITLDDATYTLTAEGKDKEKIWKYTDKEIPADQNTMTDALKAISVDEFADQSPSDKEELSLILHLDNKNFPEIRIRFYRYDGSRCLVQVNDEVMGYVSRSSVINLREAVNKMVL